MTSQKSNEFGLFHGHCTGQKSYFYRRATVAAVLALTYMPGRDVDLHLKLLPDEGFLLPFVEPAGLPSRLCGGNS
jgi:hypothetical protein